MLRLPKHNTPRGFVLLADVFIVIFALLFAYLVRFDSSAIPFEEELEIFKTGLPFFIAFRIAGFLIFRSYQGIIRHTSYEDVKRVFLALSTGSVLLGITSFIKYIWFDDFFLFPNSILAVEFIMSIFLLLMFRFTIKIIYVENSKVRKNQAPTLIYGSGTYGLITKHTLEKELGLGNKIFCFIDDDKRKAGKLLEGVKIYHPDSLEKLIKHKNIKKLIVAIKNPSKGNKRAVVNICLENNVEVLNVPSPDEWINGEFSSKQIKPVRIEDLLGREVIDIHHDGITEEFNNKVILVTGAAGSIGSELVKQLIEHSPRKVIMLDQAESPLYDLQVKLRENKTLSGTETVIADISNYQRMKNVFKTFNPDIVFHAAAYKHVPLMEDNPSEALQTNVNGTKNLVDLSIDYKVEKFIMVSTDKAVNPTNVMGCSKRIAEIYAQSSNAFGRTKFITTRFGNVLGSNGSVIPLFKSQIEAGGPLTVTHREITRYLMTIPEACQLVLEAGIMGQCGEIFVFDMGESVKIYDLAVKMIGLSGLKLGEDINIKITGLRPGEKLYEELLTTEENTLPTHHPQIMIAKVKEYDYGDITSQIEGLTELYDAQNNTKIVQCMKSIVPEYKSNNSVFEKLD